MSNTKQEITEAPESIPTEQNPPQCLAISERGIKTAQDFACFMSLMIGDTISGRLSTLKASTAARTGSVLLKVIEMQHRYGSEEGGSGKKTLRLVD